MKKPEIKLDWEERFADKFCVMLERSLYTDEQIEEVYDFIRKLLSETIRKSDAEIKFGIKEALEAQEKRIERACRLYLQDMWNDQSEIQALSPDGKEIIWGGIVGKQITKEWKKIVSKLKEV